MEAVPFKEQVCRVDDMQGICCCAFFDSASRLGRWWQGLADELERLGKKCGVVMIQVMQRTFQQTFLRPLLPRWLCPYTSLGSFVTTLTRVCSGYSCSFDGDVGRYFSVCFKASAYENEGVISMVLSLELPYYLYLYLVENCHARDSRQAAFAEGVGKSFLKRYNKICDSAGFFQL